ncbi:pyridoxamine 5'-phosphate oxidase [Ornithinimicrobium tianjinense]|uniref:Pyridoxine/pyridoxamine 5'-phosphate oxidase n=1 Tax=Ornithinimicrobium tianjinense TaxID=1195761 RepID=A0A917F0H1_9MICO|nr:pyridoxamine 5'-phosphate oxidase [Ornithinimicrobium tianjinense]GGF38308.1 pyridoxine/pyridoxamine 5'-phosphate oxidase [Ornithinimicrobium tianjinense]
MQLRHVRTEYDAEGLDESVCPEAPLEILRAWVEAAIQRQADHGDVPEPTAMAVATVDAAGAPDVRTVLMRGLDARGVCFYTNTASAKGEQLAANPAVAATLTWAGLHRAVRLRGRAELLSEAEVHDYFVTRPWGSRVGAHASAQSRPVPDRASLEAAYRESAERFPDTGSPEDVPVPQTWGGYRIVPERVELWAGRRSRLHDRIVWERVGPGGLDDPTAWRRSRLAP